MKKNHTIILTVSFLLSISFFKNVAAKEIIYLNGTGAAMSVMKIIAISFEKKNPSIQIKISSAVAGSGGGIRGLLANKLDVAISARALKPDEQKQGLKQWVFARSAFVFAVSKKNTQESHLTLQKLVDIYSGKTIHWPDGNRLRLILRPKADSDTLMLRAMSGSMDQAMTDQQCANMLESIEGSFSTSMLSLIIAEKRQLKVLPIDGVYPSHETVKNGSYPYHKKFRVITVTRPRASIQTFVNYLKSSEVVKILANNGSEAL
jgi:phosphate transport system substrate-binding protein